MCYLAHVLQEMLQHELSRFQNSACSDVRIDPEASATGDSFNHSQALGCAELLGQDGDMLESQQPFSGRTSGGAKRSRSARNGTGKSRHQWGSHVRSSCADEIIAAALNDGSNNTGSTRAPEPQYESNRQREAASGLDVESLGPAPIQFEPSRGCEGLLAEWGTRSRPELLARLDTENASAQLNSIERMLDKSVAERDVVDRKQVCSVLL